MDNGKSISLIADAPIPFNKIKKLHVLLKYKSDKVVRNSNCEKVFEIKKLIENMCGLRCGSVIIDSKSLDVVCNENLKKPLKKLIKKEKKNHLISVDKKEDDTVDNEVLRKAITHCIEIILQSKGWMKFQNKLFVQGDFECIAKSIPMASVNLGVYLESNNKIIFLISPNIIRIKTLSVIDLLPVSFQSKFESNADVNLEDWFLNQDEENLINFKCKLLPDFREGIVTGCTKAFSSEISKDTFQWIWYEKYGLRLPDDFFLVQVSVYDDKDEEEKHYEIIPSCCVLTCPGIMSVCLSLREKKIKSAMDDFMHDISTWEFFDGGCLQFQLNSEHNSQTKPTTFVHSNTWQSGSEILKQKFSNIQLQVPNLSVSNIELYKQAKPNNHFSFSSNKSSLSFLKEEEDQGIDPFKQGIKQNRNENKIEYENKKLILPLFHNRKLSLSSSSTISSSLLLKSKTKGMKNDKNVNAKKPFNITNHSSMLTVHKKTKSQPSIVSKTSSNFDSKRKSTEAMVIEKGIKRAKTEGMKNNQKNELSKVECEKDDDKKENGRRGEKGGKEKEGMKGKVDEKEEKRQEAKERRGENEGKGGGGKKEQKGKRKDEEKKKQGGEKGSKASVRKKASDIDDKENSTMVRLKHNQGKLKDLAVPHLKNFILAHNLGKVGGKKEELINRIQIFLKSNS